jgi:hypothetical protein
MIKNDTYLLKNTHLKLGSKIHITDFVFAKRLFQKSAFAAKFAFNIATNIYNELYPKSQEADSSGMMVFLPGNEDDEIILIGYAYYSELLTSRAELILKNVYKIKNISHIIIDNENEINFSFHFKKQFPKRCLEIDKNPRRRYLYCIITPISSTLTTPIKIENEFYRQIKHYCNKKCRHRINGKCTLMINSQLILSNQTLNSLQDFFDFRTLPFQTIVVVGNKKINEDYGSEKETVENSLNYWGKIEILDKDGRDIKEIITKNRLLDEKRRNQFHIYVKSHWEKIYSCRACFPENLMDEKPLFEADKSLLTPDFIFDLPKTAEKIVYQETFFQLEDSYDQRSILKPHISKEMVKYGHFRGKNKHFFYYIKYNEFYNGNENAIINWACSMKKNYFDHTVYENDRILLITPDKSTSGLFAFIVNRYIFNESCNIISYNPHEENISNFERFFSNWLLNNDHQKVHIYYVDNLVAKGNTALAVHDAVKLVRQKNTSDKNSNQPGLAGVFAMINRLDFYDFENIQRKIRSGYSNPVNNIFSFSSLNFPVFQTLTNEAGNETGCYLCNSLRNYQLLSRECSLDNIRQYIIEKNLTKREIKSKFEEPLQNEDEFGDALRIKRLCISHFLNKSFSEDSLIEYFKNEISKKDFPNFRNDFRVKFLKDYNLTEISDYDLKCTLIKIMSEPPFILYRNIKKTVFGWILFELSSTLTAVNLCIENNSYNLDDLHYLRLLVKKGAQLNINYLISIQSLVSLLKIAAYEEIIKRDLNQDSDEKLKRFLNFRFLVISSFKESLFNNEPKSIKFESNLNCEEVISASMINSSSQRLYESLIFENTGVIRQAFRATEILFENTEFDYKNRGNSKINSEHELAKKLNEIVALGDNKIENIKHFIFSEETENSDFDNFKAKPFINSLCIYRYLRILSTLKPEPNEHISGNSEYLLEQFCKLLGINENNGGSFLLIKYQNIGEKSFDDRNFYVISKYGKEVNDFICCLENSQNSFVKDFLKGREFKITSAENSIKYYWTAIGAYRHNNIWKLQDHCNDTDYVPFENYSESIYSKDFNRFYFIRISKWNNESSTDEKLRNDPQAVIVFFDNNTNEFQPETTRYALTLRNEISDFISNNFENDAFRALVESEKNITELKLLREEADKERLEKELLLELYNIRFEKFSHGAKQFIEELQDEIINKRSNCTLLLSFLVQSHINIGEFYQNYLQDLNIITEPGKKERKIEFRNDFIIALSQINLRNENHEIKYDDFQFNNILSKIPVRYLEFIIFECISNSLANSHQRKIFIILAYNVDSNYIIIESRGKQIPQSFDIDEFNVHLKSEKPNLKYGIGLFVVNRIVHETVGKDIEALLGKEYSSFIIKVPLI